MPEETRLLREAREAGATRVMNGDVMLIEQSVTAFELWTGEKAPVDVIRKQLKASRNKPDVPVEPTEDQAVPSDEHSEPTEEQPEAAAE